MITFECTPVNSISIASMTSTEVLSIEVACMAVIIPPCTFIKHGTVTSIPLIIVVVECSKAFTIGSCIVSCEGITWSACIATNIEEILGGSIADREESVSGKLLHSLKISEGHFELGVFCPRSEAVNVLQTQSVFTVRVTKAINIAGPVAVEVDRAIYSPLDDLPLHDRPYHSTPGRVYHNLGQWCTLLRWYSYCCIPPCSYEGYVWGTVQL